MVIPAALLRRFYVDGSLRNEKEGVVFQIKNLVAPTTLVSLGPIEIDERLFSPAEIEIESSKARKASAVTEKTPLFLAMNKDLTIRLDEIQLTAGEHHLLLHAVTREVGPVVIDVTEVL